MSDLSDFFKLVSEEKRKKKKELESLISDSFDDLFLKPLEETVSSPKKEKIPKKNKKKVIVEETIQENTSFGEPTLIQKSLGLLAEPIKTNNSDPLTPLNQKFATFDDLQKHYKIFIDRVQQQLSTLGGGGESNLTYMDVPITSVTTSSYTITLKDYYIGVNYAGAVTITLPRADREGKIFIVKDELGEASKGTNRYITILPTGSDLIDGRDRAILAYDYGSLTFIWKNNSWRVV
jgi:hypothetical protein